MKDNIALKPLVLFRDNTKAKTTEDLDENNNISPNKGQGRGSQLQRMLVALRQSKKTEDEKENLDETKSKRTPITYP